MEGNNLINYLIKTANNRMDVTVNSSVGVVPNQIKHPSEIEGIRLYTVDSLNFWYSDLSIEAAVINSC
jgi:hypothetical protein